MITIVGIGPGSGDFLFEKSRELVKQADQVIGSERQLAIFTDIDPEKRKILPKKLSVLQQYLETHSDKEIVLLASGDPFLYGIAAWLVKKLPKNQIKIIPGISSIQYLFNAAKVSMADSYLTSSHGRVPDFDLIAGLSKVAVLTDEKIGPYEIAQEILLRGENKYFLIGENLSYPDEKLSWYLASDVPKKKYEMNVVVILDER